MADTQRYWDGSKWTSHIAPMPPQSAPQAAPTSERWSTQRIIGTVLGSLILGWIALNVLVAIARQG